MIYVASMFIRLNLVNQIFLEVVQIYCTLYAHTISRSDSNHKYIERDSVFFGGLKINKFFVE